MLKAMMARAVMMATMTIMASYINDGDDGDDIDDGDGDAGAVDCTTVHCTDNTRDKKLIGLNRLDDPRPIQL